MARILIADDEAGILETLRLYLVAVGHEVVGSAGSGDEAIDMAGSLEPDLVLMDIMMPGDIDGIGAATRIKREMGIPLIFITGHSDEVYRERAKSAEPSGYLVKPFQLEQLQIDIDRILS